MDGMGLEGFPLVKMLMAEVFCAGDSQNGFWSQFGLDDAA